MPFSLCYGSFSSITFSQSSRHSLQAKADPSWCPRSEISSTAASEGVNELLTSFVIELLSDLGHHDGSALAWSECRELCEKVIEEKLPYLTYSR
jgi:hypothetical protein